MPSMSSTLARTRSSCARRRDSWRRTMSLSRHSPSMDFARSLSTTHCSMKALVIAGCRRSSTWWPTLADLTLGADRDPLCAMRATLFASPISAPHIRARWSRPVDHPAWCPDLTPTGGSRVPHRSYLAPHRAVPRSGHSGHGGGPDHARAGRLCVSGLWLSGRWHAVEGTGSAAVHARAV